VLSERLLRLSLAEADRAKHCELARLELERGEYVMEAS
jgi:hypothetical protein